MKSWREQREEKQKQREPRIKFFPTKPFASQPHLKNIKMEKQRKRKWNEIEKNPKLLKEHRIRVSST